MKRQAKTAMDQASKSYGLMKQVSVLEDKVSGLVTQVMHLKECDSFLVEFIESACEQLKCKFPAYLLEFLAATFVFCILMSLRLPRTCLHPADENRRVAERIAALEKVSKDASSLWADPRRRSDVVLLQDRAQHIGKAVDGCRKSLTTMYSVMRPRNPPSGSFKQLLDVFRTSQQIHRLIKLNLVVGANFALGWIRKWHPRLNYSSMSLSFPQGGVRLQVHMDAMLQPARRIIARLLREDATFFREHHYLNPLGVDDSDRPML
jgi:hypothetical protein